MVLGLKEKHLSTTFKLARNFRKDGLQNSRKYSDTAWWEKDKAQRLW